jgi:hypothetical protein
MANILGISGRSGRSRATRDLDHFACDRLSSPCVTWNCAMDGLKAPVICTGSMAPSVPSSNVSGPLSCAAEHTRRDPTPPASLPGKVRPRPTNQVMRLVISEASASIGRRPSAPFSMNRIIGTPKVLGVRSPRFSHPSTAAQKMGSYPKSVISVLRVAAIGRSSDRWLR